MSGGVGGREAQNLRVRRKPCQGKQRFGGAAAELDGTAGHATQARRAGGRKDGRWYEQRAAGAAAEPRS